MAQMRASHPDESQLMFMAFDLLHQDGVDLRALPLSERKRDLHRLCRKSRVPFMREVQTFPNGALLFDHCSKFGFEGVVSKRLASRYSSGPSRNWVKTKCPDWKRINAERRKLFEKQPGPTGAGEDFAAETGRARSGARAAGRTGIWIACRPVRRPQGSRAVALDCRRYITAMRCCRRSPSWRAV